MGNVQIIHTASGEELVVMDRRDYDALMSLVSDIDEDEDDVAMYDARKAEIVASGETPLPEAVSAAVLKGDSLLKAVRRWRGISQTAIAEKIGIGQGYLSDLESRRRAGTSDTLRRLAETLDVPVGWFLPTV